jgi:hypothetical protein
MAKVVNLAGASEDENLTDAQRTSRLPRRPWHINLYENSGVTSYQVQGADGEVIGQFSNDDYRIPGTARAIAESLVKWANEEGGVAGD